MIRTAIFDMDGILVDSEALQSQAFERILEEEGVTPEANEQGLVHRLGVREEENWNILKEKYDLVKSVSALKTARQPVYLSLLRQNIRPLPGAVDLVSRFASTVAIGVASSAPRKQVDTVLSLLQIDSIVRATVSGDDVQRGKPHPDCYLKTAQLLEENPEHCIVFEDSRAGVEAGKNAGMLVIAIPNKYTKHQDLSRADSIVSSAKDIVLEEFAPMDTMDITTPHAPL